MSTPDKEVREKEKKGYHSPVIRYYGAVRTLTETVGKVGALDNGTGQSMNKTR